MIFVFGSNLAGMHGAGAARTAHRLYGARMGVSFGLTGDAFAIPTKDEKLQTLPLDVISDYVELFLWHTVNKYADKQFKISRIGCGLAGYKNEEIAPLFVNPSSNCWFDTQWKEWLPDGTKFWGTHQD